MILDFDIEDKHIDSVIRAYDRVVDLATAKSPAADIKKAERTYQASLRVVLANIQEQLDNKILELKGE